MNRLYSCRRPLTLTLSAMYQGRLGEADIEKMLPHEPQHASLKQIPPYRLPANQCNEPSCSGRTGGSGPSKDGDGKQGGTLESLRPALCTEEILEESHYNPTLSPCPPQPLSRSAIFSFFFYRLNKNALLLLCKSSCMCLL